MKKPKISLVICAYNEEKCIGACLEHATKNARGKLYEILVVNNASSDKTREVAEKYKEVRVVDEERKGQVRARQRSLREVRGDIIAYLDADTQMPDGWMDILIHEFSNNPDLACLSGPYIFYDFPKWKNVLCLMYWYIFAYPIYLIVGYMAVGGNVVIRKDVLDKMNGFNTSIEFYGEDTDIARRASKFGRVKFRLDFIISSSARRLVNQGIMRTNFIYILNFFSQVFFKKSATSQYKDIR